MGVTEQPTETAGSISKPAKELLWADIGEKLGLSVSSMRSIRQRFGGLLGIPASNKVPENLLGAISFIVTLRRRGIPDDQIEKQLKQSKVGEGWPEEVLSRMEHENAAFLTPLAAAETARRSAQQEPCFQVGFAQARGRRSKSDERNKTFHATPSANDGASPVEALEVESDSGQVSKDDSMFGAREEWSIPEDTRISQREPIREMILDLRREICTHVVSEREEIERLHQVIQNLVWQVRDLRYALLMASSRKDRKRGYRGISRLLSR